MNGASQVAGEWWAQALGSAAALATLLGVVFRRWPRAGRWFWGLFTANVRAAILDREVKELRSQVDRLYDDLQRSREMREMTGGDSGGPPGSGPGSGISRSSRTRRRSTP